MIDLEKCSVITNDEIGAVIGARIRTARLDKHKSQGELAEMVGVARQTISGWERNANFLPVGQLIKIFNVLHIPLEEYPIFKKHMAVVDERNKPDENEPVLPSFTAYFDSLNNREQAVKILKWIDSLSSENTNLLIELLEVIALRDHAIEAAYQQGVKDATIMCALRNAKQRDGYNAGVCQAEEDELEYTLRIIEENRKAIEDCEEADGELCDCSEESIYALHDKISDRIYEEDFEAGYEDAQRKYERDHFDGDWDDV